MENKDQNERKFLSLTEAAEYLGLQKSTMYSYCHKRVLNFYKIHNRLTYFLKEDLDNFILNEQNLVKSQSQINEEANKQIEKLQHGGIK